MFLACFYLFLYSRRVVGPLYVVEDAVQAHHGAHWVWLLHVGLVLDVGDHEGRGGDKEQGEQRHQHPDQYN